MADCVYTSITFWLLDLHPCHMSMCIRHMQTWHVSSVYMLFTWAYALASSAYVLYLVYMLLTWAYILGIVNTDAYCIAYLVSVSLSLVTGMSDFARCNGLFWTYHALAWLDMILWVETLGIALFVRPVSVWPAMPACTLGHTAVAQCGLGKTHLWTFLEQLAYP